MNERNAGEGRPVMAVLLQLQSDGLVHSWVDDQGALRWALTEAGKAFQTSAADDAVVGSTNVVSLYPVIDILVEDVVAPDNSGKLVVDIGPGARIRFSDDAVPDVVDLGLLNVALEETNALVEATPVFPRRVRMDIGMNRTRPRSKITKAEFEMVGGPVEFAGLFDLQGRLRCYSPLVQWGEGECRTARWTVCPVTDGQGETS